MEKKKRMGRKILSTILTLAMVVGLMPGISLTVHAADPTPIPIDSSGGPLPSGDYVLTSDIELTAGIQINEGSNVTINLNGYGLKGKNGFSDSVILVNEGGTLTITDTGDHSDATHYFTLDSTKKAIVNDNGNQDYSFTGGYITGGIGYFISISSEYPSKNTRMGGGVCVNGGTFVMEGGTILGNKVGTDFPRGGGVWVGNNGTFTMNGGKISYNYSGASPSYGVGAGVCVGTDSNALDGNGNLLKDKPGTFVMNGGEISYNRALNIGGGVAIQSGGNIQMTGGTIKYNHTSKSGGGVAVQTGGKIQMSGGTIEYNTASEYGGGIQIQQDGKIQMSGGTIEHNTGHYSGGGVDYMGSEFSVSGNPVIDNNVDGYSRATNLLLRESASSITVTGTLNDDALIRISDTRSNNDGRVFTASVPTDYNNPNGFASDKDEYVVVQNSDGQLYLSETYTVTYKVVNGKWSDDTSENKTEKVAKGFMASKVPTGMKADNYFKNDAGAWDPDPATEEISEDKTFTYTFEPIPHNDGSIIFDSPWTKTDSMPSVAGSYYLTEDVTLDSTWKVPEGETTLCLNGHGIRYSGDTSAYVIEVNENSILNLYDCDTTTKHYITADDKGRGTNVSSIASEGAIEVTGGYITGGNWLEGLYGGGITVLGGTLQMEGGTIVGNYTEGKGGGVKIYPHGSTSGQFIMNGGHIKGNTADPDSFTVGGGVSIDYNCTFEMKGGDITGNTAYRGGGVESEEVSSVFKMTGGRITDNIAISEAGGVFAYSQISISGNPVIKDNKCNSKKSNLLSCPDQGIIILSGLDDGAEIGLTYAGISNFTSGWGTYKKGDDPYNYFFCDSDDMRIYEAVIYSGDTELTFKAKLSSEAAAVAANEWTYDGEEHDLLTVTGQAQGGTMYYAVGDNDSTAPEFDGTSEEADKKWSMAIPEATNAGDYYVWYMVKGDEEHKSTTPVCVKVTVSKKTSEAVLTEGQKPTPVTGLKYAAQSYALVIAPTDYPTNTPTGYSKLLYRLSDTDEWTEDIPTGINAGTYTVQYKYVSDIYEDLVGTPISVTIDKAEMNKDDLFGTQKPTAIDGLEYNQTSQTLVNKPASMPAGYPGVQYKLSNGGEWSTTLPTGTDAGTYTVLVNYVGDNNHKDFEGYPIEVSIAKAAVTVKASDISKIYGEADPVFTASATGVFGSDTVTYNFTREEGEVVGTYTITPDGAATQGNYTVEYQTGTLTIKAKSADNDDITAKQKDGETLTYTGKPVKPSIVITDGTDDNKKELVEGTDYTVTYEGIAPTVYPGEGGDGSVPPTNVGKYKAVIKLQGNYTGEKGVAFDIGKASPVVKTLPTVSAITYGQNLSDSTITGGEMKGVSDEKVEGTFAWEDGTLKPTVADSEKTEYSIVFTPANTDNYKPVKVKVKVKVNGYKEDKDKLNGDQKPTAVEGLVYNGEDQILVNPPKTLPEGYTKVQYRLSDEDEWSDELPKGKDAGNYKVQVKYIGDENHIDFEGGTIDATISPKTSGDDITAKQKDDEILTYTGEPVKPSIVITDGTDDNKKELVEGKDYTVTYVGVEPTVYPGEGGDGTKAPTNAGTYKTVITFKDNYTGTKEVEFTIAKSGQEAPNSGTFTTTNADDAENTNGKIDGFDKEKTYQYSSDDGKTWTDVPKGATSIDVKASTYKIRFAGDDNHEPSEAVDITVGIASRTQGVVNFNKDEASGSEAYVETVVEEAKSSNIETFAESQVEEGKDVKVELEITPKKEDDVDKASVTEIGGAVDEVFAGIETESIVTEYLQIDLAKYVDNAKEGNISDTKSPLEIELTYDETKAGNPIVVRTHNGKAKAFGKLNERPKADFKDATYHAANGKIYLYSQYFSDFAIVYSTKKTYYVNVDLGNGDTLSQVVGENSKLNLPTDIEKDGFAFDGWYKDAEYNNEWDVDKDTVNSDISIYGKWNKSVTGVKVDVDNVTFTKADESTKLNVSVIPSDAEDKKVTFASSDSKVVTVDENGKITAVANGTATITITTEDGAKTATVKVTVAIPDVDKQGATDKPGITDQQGTTDQQAGEPTKEEEAAISMNAGLKISQTGSKINIKWGKVKEADGYDLYVTYCGESFAHKKPAKTFDKNTTVKATITKINGKKINLKKNFKLYVAAYKMVEGKKEILAKTITGHVVGRKNTKYSNAKNIKITSKTKVSIKQGKTSKIKAKTVLVSKGKKQLSDAHAKEFRYASSNNSIATVDKNGKIKGIAKGTCTIYVYSRNGYAKKVSVTVE